MRTLAARLATAALAGALASCGGERPTPVATVMAPAPPAARSFAGPVLGPDGRCEGAAPATATAIAPGIGECELVRLKGKEPTDVLVGAGGRGQREVQVLYAEPTGRELYFFVENRLDRVVK